MTSLGRYASVSLMEEDGVFDKDLKFGCSINELFKLDVLLSVIITHNRSKF